MHQLEPNKKVALTYVLIQAVILILLVFGSFESSYDISGYRVVGTIMELLGFIGILFSAYSIRTSLTAMPIPKEHGQLATNGLYKYVRHPMYTSVILLSLGLAVSSGEIDKYLLVIALTGLFYYKSVYEEKYLVRKYPGYLEYARKTSRFIPFIK